MKAPDGMAGRATARAILLALLRGWSDGAGLGALVGAPVSSGVLTLEYVDFECDTATGLVLARH